MRDFKINLSRWIILHVFLLFLPAYHFANAQSSTVPPESSYGLYSGFNPSMAIIVVVLICAFFFVGFFSIYVRECSESTGTGTIPPYTSCDRTRQGGIDPAIIEKFPIFVYSVVKEIKIGRGALECAVCLSEFEDDDRLRLLPKCDHVFHPDCIDAWLASHVTCPVCRANLTITNQNAKNTPATVTAPQIIESNTENNNALEVNDAPNEIVINVNEDQQKARISGKFPRSHSTGHSLVQPGESTERYTLRLPEEIRKQMIANAKLKRAMSFNVVLAREGSSRKGYRSGGEGSSRGRTSLDWQFGRSDRWVFSMTPPFVSKAGSVDKSLKGGWDGDVSNNNRTLLTAVKVPLNCLNVKVEQDEESSARLPV